MKFLWAKEKIGDSIFSVSFLFDQRSTKKEMEKVEIFSLI